MAIFPITANAANILPPAAYTTQVGRTQLLNAVGLERAAASGNSEKTGISLVSGRVGIETFVEVSKRGTVGLRVFLFEGTKYIEIGDTEVKTAPAGGIWRTFYASTAGKVSSQIELLLATNTAAEHFYMNGDNVSEHAENNSAINGDASAIVLFNADNLPSFVGSVIGDSTTLETIAAKVDKAAIADLAKVRVELGLAANFAKADLAGEIFKRGTAK